MEPEKKEPEKVEAELEIKKEEEKVEEKTEMQLEVEKLRNENQTLRSDLGRVPDLQNKIASLENTMDEKINNLLESRQPVKEDDIVGIDDDEYLTGKTAKQYIKDALKDKEINQGDAVEKALTAREEKSKKWNDDYTKAVARLSIDITDDETLNGILSEMDNYFRDDSIRDPEIAAKVNYSGAKASYVTKAVVAGKEVKFGSGKPPVAALGVGGGLKETVVKKEEKETKLPEDAKALADMLEPDTEKRKSLVKEALG